MDYQDDLQIAEQFPQPVAHYLNSSSSKKLPSPINSANRFFQAFPSDFKRKTGISYFQNSQKRSQMNLISAKGVKQNEGSDEQQKSRNLKQFLQFQKTFADQKERKLIQLKQDREREEAQQCRNTPTINSHSRRLTSHLESTCYQRLSRDKPVERVTTQMQFHPKILNRSKSIYRKENVSDLLYDDAQRRIEKQKVLNNERINNQRPTINTNTDKLVIKTLKNQFCRLIKDADSVNEEQVIGILNHLFNTNFNLEDINQQSQKCKKLLNYLFPNHLVKLSTKKLWSFIQISNGCKQTTRYFVQRQEKQIQKQFKHFLYRNRMLIKQKTKTYQNQPTFRPQILKNSKRLAQKKRNRMITQAEEVLEKQNIKINMNDSYQLPIADLYILQRMHNQQENKLRKEINSQKQFQKCTFKPILTKWNGIKQADIIPLSTKSSRARQSFNRKNQQAIDSCQNQNTLMTNSNTLDSIDYHFNTTTTTHIQQKRSNSKNGMMTSNKSLKSIKNIQSTILRMSAGRKQKQYRNKCQQRGYPKDIDNWESFRRLEKKAVEKSSKSLKGYDDIPKTSKGFIFDIYINNGVLETIHLNKDQDIITKVEQLEEKYNLNQQKKIKLVKMIKNHLCSYLETEKQNNRYF